MKTFIKEDSAIKLLTATLLVVFIILLYVMIDRIVSNKAEIAVLKKEISILKYQIEVDKFQTKSSSDI